MIANFPSRSYTSIERLLYPFDRFIWLILVSLVATAFTLIYSIHVHVRARAFFFGAGNRTPFLNVLNIVFGGAITVAPRRNFARTILSLWIMCTFVLRNSYQGALYGFLSSEKPAQSLDTLDKLVEHNITIFTPRRLHRALIESMPSLRNKYSDSISAISSGEHLE